MDKIMKILMKCVPVVIAGYTAAVGVIADQKRDAEMEEMKQAISELQNKEEE